MIDLDHHPAILPSGYRLRTRFALLPIEVAGRRRWLESVRVVQRLSMNHNFPRFFSDHRYEWNWSTVGFWEEILPTLGKAPAGVGWSE
jgi:hypothetical protein